MFPKYPTNSRSGLYYLCIFTLKYSFLFIFAALLHNSNAKTNLWNYQLNTFYELIKIALHC